MMLEEIPNQVHTVLGPCHGVCIATRGENDLHLCIYLLTEDDYNWFTSENSFSSFWLNGVIDVLGDALDWLRKHADRDPSGYGYVLRVVEPC